MSGVVGYRPLSFGAEPSGERLARIERSPLYDKAAGEFRNPVPSSTTPRPTRSRGDMARALLRSEGRKPNGRIPLARPDLSVPPASGLRLTWMGHSSVLAEIDGRRVLFDPVWGSAARRSPSPGRAGCIPLPCRSPRSARSTSSSSRTTTTTISTCPPSGRWPPRDIRFAVPLGVGAHLERWGVSAGPARASWTGTRPREIAGLDPDRHPGPSLLRARAAQQAAHAVGLLGRSRATSTGSSTAATPATSPASRKSARSTARSTRR